MMNADDDGGVGGDDDDDDGGADNDVTVTVMMMVALMVGVVVKMTIIIIIMYADKAAAGVGPGLVLALCALGPQEISTVRLGPLTPYAVTMLRHIRDILGITFSIKPEGQSQTLFLSCIGSGLRNTAKRVT